MKNKYISILSLLAFSMLFFSCSDDEASGIAMNIKLEYEGEPLVFFEDVEFPDGRNFEFTRFSFYISDLSLIKDGDAVDVLEVDYLDLTASHSDLLSAQNGFDYQIELSEPLGYDEIQFRLGLSEEQNSTSPQDHPSSSSLSLSGEYWANWNSYVFVKIEGRMDLDGDGISDGIALHLGADNASRMIRFQGLDSDEELNISIEMKDIFENFDIDANPRIHSLNQLDQIQILMDNLSNSILVQN